MLFSEPKIPQWLSGAAQFLATFDVSVLFSEPKIPQSPTTFPTRCRRRVSVLFSEPKIPQFDAGFPQSSTTFWFQCSSASRKFLNLSVRSFSASSFEGFSALQRAENSSIVAEHERHRHLKRFQCSSASRKFLNVPAKTPDLGDFCVSVLFSEPKIPQSISPNCANWKPTSVSVLFSEPKIPQCRC